MKILFEKNTDNNTSVVIKPRRVFKCTSRHCGLVSPRDKVRKVVGKYYCRCGELAEDYTNSITGHDIIEIVGL